MNADVLLRHARELIRAVERGSWALKRIAYSRELVLQRDGFTTDVGECKTCGSIMRSGTCPTWSCAVCGNVNPSEQPTGGTT